MLNDPVVLVSGVRTAIGRFGGSLAAVESAELGAACIREAITRAGVEPEEVDEVVMGQVGQVGPDAYNARRCALGAGLPPTSTAMNVNRLCSSGLQAIVSGAQELLVDQVAVVVAGGNESMSRQPYLEYGGRSSGRLGDRVLLDGTLSLVTDPFGRYPMGVTAEKVAEQFGVTREEQDEFALRSQERATAAIDEGSSKPDRPRGGHGRRRAVPSRRASKAGRRSRRLRQLRPAFQDSGTVTAGNASGVNDGAAAVVMMRRSEAERRASSPGSCSVPGRSPGSNPR